MPRGRPRNPKTLDTDGGLITARTAPPSHLDTVAKKYWREILSGLIKKRILDKIDLGNLAALCEAYSEYIRTLKLLKGKIPMVQTEKGNWIQHPLLGVKNHAVERYLKFAREFGMTPAARARIAENQISAADKFKKYMS